MILAGNVFITNPLNLTILVIKTLPARVIVCVFGRKLLSLIEANRVSPQLYVNTEEILMVCHDIKRGRKRLNALLMAGHRYD